MHVAPPRSCPCPRPPHTSPPWVCAVAQELGAGLLAAATLAAAGPAAGDDLGGIAGYLQVTNTSVWGAQVTLTFLVGGGCTPDTFSVGAHSTAKSQYYNNACWTSDITVGASIPGATVRPYSGPAVSAVTISCSGTTCAINH